MDTISPDQYQSGQVEDRIAQAYSLLSNRRQAVLAMSTGGCARYAFSSDIHYCMDRRGYPLINYISANPHHHLIITNSTMDLRLVHQIDAEGNELSLLILTGMLKLVDPGDHDSIDRHCRYYKSVTENYSRGASRLYRFIPETACFEQFSGERLPMPVASLIRRNPFSEKEELVLIDSCQQHFLKLGNPSVPVLVAGVDGHGVDLKMKDGIAYRPFAETVESIHAAELAITGLSADDSATF